MKKILYIICGLLLLMVISLIAVISFINPNEFKPLIVNEVKKATGQQLVIDGDIKWQFWPDLGLSIDKIALQNPKGFEQANLASLNRVSMSVAVMPLFEDKLDIGIIKLYGTNIFIQTQANGTSNLDAFLKSKENSISTEQSKNKALENKDDLSEKKESATKDVSEEPAPSKWSISLAGLELVDANVSIQNDQQKTHQQITNLNMNIGQLVKENWVPISFDMNGKVNELKFTAKGNTQALLSNAINASQLKNIKLEITLNNEQISISKLNLEIDKLGLTLLSALKIAIKGNTNDINFIADGSSIFSFDEKENEVKIANNNWLTSLTRKSIPKSQIDVDFKGDILFSIENKIITVDKIETSINDVKILGDTSVMLSDVPKIQFNLTSSNINIDNFLVKPQESIEKKAIKTDKIKSDDKTNKTTPSSAQKQQSSPTILSDIEPDLSGLRSFDLIGKLSIGKLIANQVVLSDVLLDVMLLSGKLSVNQFKANLYDGAINAKASLNAQVSPAHFEIENKIENVKIQPLLSALIDKKFISGKSNIDINIKGVGLSPLKLRSGITGFASLALTDGSIDGINIGEMIREAKAKLKGKGDSYVAQTKKTDFSSFMGSFNFVQGIASTNDIKVQAAGINISSDGETNLVNETLKFKLFVSLIGKGNKDISDLRGITIPINVNGTWAKPSYQLDIRSLIKNSNIIKIKTRKEVERGLNKLLGDKDKNKELKQAADHLLNNLFN